MRAIEARYAGPTNARGSRVLCRELSDHGRRMAVPWDDALGIRENNDAAAKVFLQKLGWSGRWAGGDTACGAVYVRVDEGAVFVVREAVEKSCSSVKAHGEECWWEALKQTAGLDDDCEKPDSQHQHRARVYQLAHCARRGES